MSANIFWTERYKNLSAECRPSVEKENMFSREQSGNSIEGKNVGQKKGLSVRTESWRNNMVHMTLARKSPAGGVQSQISCNDSNESDRSRSRARGSVRGEGIKNRRSTEMIGKTVSTKVLKKGIATNSSLGLVLQRARSLSNNRNRASVTKENKLTVKSFQRSYSATRNLSWRARPPTPNSHTPKTGYLTNEVKKRTISSIQTWKDKMNKLHTSSARRTVDVPAKNLPVAYSDENATKINLQKTCVIDNIRMSRRQSDTDDAFNPGISRNNSNVKESIRRDRTAGPVRHAIDTTSTFFQDECAAVQQDETVLCAQSDVGASASSTSHHMSKRVGRRLSVAGKLNSSIITPVDAHYVLTLTPTKVRYEKHRSRYMPSVSNNLDDIDHILRESDYLEFVVDVERKREESTPKLSSRFLRESINAQQRKIVVGYLIRVSTHCPSLSHIVYHAVKLFDIAVDRILVCTDYIQLMALACLWITLKRDVTDHKMISATAILNLAKGLYVGQEKRLLEYEKKILTALKFNICFADPLSLLSYYIWIVNRDTQYNIDPKEIKIIYYCASYLIDVSMLDENLCNTSACVVAMAAADLSFGFVSSNNVKTRQSYCQFWRSRSSCTEWEEREVKHVKEILITLVLNSDRFGSEVVHKKYLRSKHGKISNFLLNNVLTLSAMNVADLET